MISVTLVEEDSERSLVSFETPSIPSIGSIIRYREDPSKEWRCFVVVQHTWEVLGYRARSVYCWVAPHSGDKT